MHRTGRRSLTGKLWLTRHWKPGGGQLRSHTECPVCGVTWTPGDDRRRDTRSARDDAVKLLTATPGSDRQLTDNFK
jgi:hypothetical protein